MHKTIIVFLFLLIGGNSWAQILLRGEAVDSTTSAALPFCQIKTNEGFVVADGQGAFTMEFAHAGKVVIVCNYLGHQQSFDLDLRQDTFLILKLAVPTQWIKGVEVHGHVHHAEEVVAVVTSVSKFELERKGAITLGDALEGVNGVGFLKTGGSIAKPVLNGMHSSRVLVYNAGSRLENQQWGSEHAPGLDPLNGGSIEVLKGASTLLYGNDAIGGVVRLLPGSFRETEYAHIKLFSRIQSNPVGGQLGVQFERFDSTLEWGNRLTLNARKVGDAYAPNYVLSNTGHTQASISYYSHLHLGKHLLSLNASSFNQTLGILEASHIGNQSDLNRALQSDTPLVVNAYTFAVGSPYQSTHHHSGQLIWELLNLQAGDLKASLSQQVNQRKEFDRHGGTAEAALQLNLLTTQLNVLLDKHIKGLRIEYGSMIERQQNVFSGRYFIPNYLRHKIGLFAVSTYKGNESLFELGLRYDRLNNSTFRYVNDQLTNDVLSFSGFSASLGMQHPFGKHLKLNTGISRKFRAPEVNELFSDGLHHGSAALEFGDLQLTEEIAYSFNLALNYQASRWQWSIEPYLHYFDGFINLEPTGETQLSIRGAFPVFRYIQSEVVYAGLDARLKFIPSSAWQMDAQFNAIYAENLNTSSFIYGVPAPRFQLNGRYLFDAASKLADSYLQCRVNYVFRHSWAERTVDFMPPPASYFLLGLDFGKQFKKIPGSLILQVNNLLNQSYRDYMNRYRYFANEQGIQFNLIFNYTLKNNQK